jgi:hypothetical protein
MESRSIVVILVSIIVILGAASWTKPQCRDGYVASLFFFEGWACVPGYKAK